MCTLLIAIDQHPDYPWIIAANRDEFRDRPTAPMAWWADHPGLLAGRDLRAGGTWMGITRKGRFAAVTNYREARCVYPRGPSRGALVADFLSTGASPRAYLERIAHRGRRYDGFNLIVGEVDGGLFYYGNRDGDGGDPASRAPVQLSAGIFGLSNHRLDTPWPKVKRGKALFAACLQASGKGLDACILRALGDTYQPADADLPDTGVGLDWERILAPLFINTPHYGTRSCSVVRLDHNGQLAVVERTIAQPGETGPRSYERRFCFRVEQQ
jgi:uncharacterized protein with NRDE domain